MQGLKKLAQGLHSSRKLRASLSKEMFNFLLWGWCRLHIHGSQNLTIKWEILCDGPALRANYFGDTLSLCKCLHSSLFFLIKKKREYVSGAAMKTWFIGIMYNGRSRLNWLSHSIILTVNLLLSTDMHRHFNEWISMAKSCCIFIRWWIVLSW